MAALVTVRLATSESDCTIIGPFHDSVKREFSLFVGWEELPSSRFFPWASVLRMLPDRLLPGIRLRYKEEDKMSTTINPTATPDSAIELKVCGNVVTGQLDGHALTFKVGNSLRDFARANSLNLETAEKLYKPFRAACWARLAAVKMIRTAAGKPKKKRRGETVAARRFVAGGSSSFGSIDGGEHRHIYTGRPDEFEMERGVKRCRFCGKPAISGSDLCYTCESD